MTDHLDAPPELMPPPACDCCGVPSSYRRGSIWHGRHRICLPCFIIWYDCGLTDSHEIRKERLKRCGTRDVEATERRSLEHIYRNEFPMFTRVRKPSRRKLTLDLGNPSPQFEKAKDAYDELAAKGETPTIKAVCDAANVGQTSARRAIAHKRAEAQLDPLTPREMSATMARRFELAVRNARVEIREELRQEIYDECDVLLRHIKERSDRADRILASHQGVMSKESFRRIKACLHPDHNTFAFAAEAMQIFGELENVLVKPDEQSPGASSLPQTVAELMARRRR